MLIEVDNKQIALLIRQKKPFRPPRDETTEYRTSYKPINNPTKPRIRKAFEAEHVHDQVKFLLLKKYEIKLHFRDDENYELNVHIQMSNTLADMLT